MIEGGVDDVTFFVFLDEVIVVRFLDM